MIYRDDWGVTVPPYINSYNFSKEINDDDVVSVLDLYQQIFRRYR